MKGGRGEEEGEEGGGRTFGIQPVSPWLYRLQPRRSALPCALAVSAVS